MSFGVNLMIKPLFFASTILGLAAMSSAQMNMMHSRYGGPTYTGAPTLDVTVSVLKAGGGPMNFSIAKALTSIGGEKLITAELGKLTKQYGKMRVGRFVKVFDFAVADAVKMVMAAKVELPDGNMMGGALGGKLIMLGQDKSGTFYTENLLDHLLTHKIHMAVMDDIDAKFGESADKDYHRISNQAHYDLGKALGMRKLKLAKLH